MNVVAARALGPTVAMLPAEDVVVLQSGTPWRVSWELLMLGPFASCGLLDGTAIRHVTVPRMIRSAITRSTRPQAALVPSDYERLPVFAGGVTVAAAALLVADTGWDLAVVMDTEPRVISARSVFRALTDGGDPCAISSRLVELSAPVSGATGPSRSR